jgi:lysophospholipase L1-like esterase
VRLVAIGLGIALALAVTEIALRFSRLPVRADVSAALFPCYSEEYEDASIEYESVELSINLLRPNADSECASSGYRWHHHGDAYGYRNPESWSQADVVLLGDSTTYGHGVEETSTAAHFLREELGRTVVNLGWTGDSPIQYLARFRNYALPLHPRLVLVFFFQNDFDDILKYRSPQAIRRFVETGEARETRVYTRDELVAMFHPRGARLGASIGEHFLTLRALRFFLEPHAHRHEDPDQPYALVPPLEEEVPLQGAEQLAVDYLQAAAAMMAQSAKEHGIRLVFSTIPAVDAGRRLQLLRQHVNAAAQAVGVPFLDLVGKLAVDGRLERGDYFLAHDGHLTESGHRRVAREVAAFIREQKLLEGP